MVSINYNPRCIGRVGGHLTPSTKKKSIIVFFFRGSHASCFIQSSTIVLHIFFLFTYVSPNTMVEMFDQNKVS